MTELERLTIKAQIGLSILFLSGYFVVLILFMLGFARVPVDYKEAFAGLLGLMTAGGLSIPEHCLGRPTVDRPAPHDDTTGLKEE